MIRFFSFLSFLFALLLSGCSVGPQGKFIFMDSHEVLMEAHTMELQTDITITSEGSLDHPQLKKIRPYLYPLSDFSFKTKLDKINRKTEYLLLFNKNEHNSDFKTNFPILLDMRTKTLFVRGDDLKKFPNFTKAFRTDAKRKLISYDFVDLGTRYGKDSFDKMTYNNFNVSFLKEVDPKKFQVEIPSEVDRTQGAKYKVSVNLSSDESLLFFKQWTHAIFPNGEIDIDGILKDVQIEPAVVSTLLTASGRPLYDRFDFTIKYPKNSLSMRMSFYVKYLKINEPIDFDINPDGANIIEYKQLLLPKKK